MKIVGRVQKTYFKKKPWKLPLILIKAYSTPKNTYEDI